MKSNYITEFLKSHLFIITLILVIKTMLLRFLLFEELNITKTLFLELGYIVAFASLIELIAVKGKPFFYLLLNAVFSTLLLAVILYYSFFGRIVTYFALFQLGQVDTINESVTALIEPVYGLFFVDIAIFIVLLVIRKYPIKNRSLNKKLFVIPLLVVALGISFATFMIHKNEVISNNVIAAQEKGILNYEALEVYYGSESQILVDIDVSVDNVPKLKQEIREVKGIEQIPQEERNYFNTAEKRNLIVIQVESMQNFPIGLKVGGEEVTPHINKMLDNSFYFPNTVQQTGPGNTSDAEFIFNTSLYPLAFNPTSQTYGNKKFPSLPRLLKAEGYATMTFHADDIEFWNRDELYPALGFEHYYDGKFFGNKDVIGIGPSDEVLFDKALPVLKGYHLKDQPFYAQLIGLTSHHPFKLPADEAELELPDKFKGSLTGDYLQSINYMDRKINNFIEKLKQAGIYEESVIVIYGDHFGLQQSAMDQEDVDLVSDLLGNEYKLIDRLNIPFIIHAPGITDQGKTLEKTSGQLDMMPTVANLLGISLEDQVVFGQDLLNYDKNLLGVRYYLPIGSFFNNEILFVPKKGFEDGTAYDLQTEEVIEDYEKYKEDYNRVLKLEKLSDTYLKSLPERK
ncbi:LTA synthase family protein [Virgibacillus sp. DJP39]|uniref:LTA synthase family protein n=1 Tax=Virgibacillus sp. DJP39 TaxID=3409790 RepID=UPI003BB53DEB